MKRVRVEVEPKVGANRICEKFICRRWKMFMPSRELFGCCSVGRLVLPVLVLVNLSPAVVSQVSQRSFGSQPRRIVEAAPFTYEVVIVRKSRPTARVIASIDDQAHSGSFSANHELVTKVIQDAYGVDSTHVVGGPPWANSDYFDILAKSSASVNNRLRKLDDDTARSNKQHMLQILLADRFKLRVHVVTEEVMAYSLVGAKTGPRLRNLSHASFDANGTSSASPQTPRIQLYPSPAGYQLVAQGILIKSLASILSYQLKAPVMDDSGLHGVYDVTLQFRPQGREETSDTWPSIATAVEKQLGLELVPRKAHISTVVIDSIQPPMSR